MLRNRATETVGNNDRCSLLLFLCEPRKSDPKLLGRVDIYARRVHNSPIILYRSGEVPSPNGLGDPTPTKDHASVHPLDCLVAMRCQQNLMTPCTNCLHVSRITFLVFCIFF